MFPSISVAGSGLEVDQTWIDAIGGNVANAEDAVTPGKSVYRDQEVVAAASPPAGGSSVGDGVEVEGIELGSAEGTLTYDPGNPIADSRGYVTYPSVNIGHEMTSLVEAQVSYEVNAKVLQNATDAYQAILNIKA